MANEIKPKPLRLGENLIKGVKQTGNQARQVSQDALQAISQVQGVQSQLSDSAAINAGLLEMRTNRIARQDQQAQNQLQQASAEAGKTLAAAQAKEKEIRGLGVFQILGRALTGGDLGINKFARETKAAEGTVKLLQQRAKFQQAKTTSAFGMVSKQFAAKKAVISAKQKELDSFLKTQSMQVDFAVKAQDVNNKTLDGILKSFEVVDEVKGQAFQQIDTSSLPSLAAEAKANGGVDVGGVKLGAGELEQEFIKRSQSQQTLQNAVLAGQMKNLELEKLNKTTYIKQQNKFELKQIAAQNYQVPTGETDANGQPVMLQLSPEEVDKQMLELDKTTNARVEAMKVQPDFPALASSMSRLTSDTNNLALKIGEGNKSRPLANVMQEVQNVTDAFDATIQLHNQQAADAGVTPNAIPFDSTDIGLAKAQIADVQKKFEKVKETTIKNFSTVPEVRQAFAGYVDGTGIQADQALELLARSVLGGADGLKITDPINALFAENLQKELFKLAKRHEFKGAEGDFGDMNESQRSNLMASVMDAIANKGKDGKLLGRPQLVLAIRNASKESEVRRIESYYGRSFATVTPEERRRVIEAGGTPSGLANFQIQQAFETARVQAPKAPGYENMSQREKIMLDAQLTLQALSLIPMAGAKTGKDVFLEQLGSGKSTDTLKQMESDQQNGTFVDYLFGQSGVQNSLAQSVHQQNQLFQRANAGMEEQKMKDLNNIVGNLQDEKTRGNAIARLAVYQVSGTQEDQALLNEMISKSPGLKLENVQAEIKKRIKSGELAVDKWGAIGKLLGAAADTVAEVGKAVVNGTLTVLANPGINGPSSSPIQPIDVFGSTPDQAAKDQLRRLKAGEGK